eukprot:TRINITY_DN1348_c0_g1_i3.p1 TRINITY_DN1348_c0_g1~~TRINITY_DN1348_c0_g1_i3.p1  ORF type:complete len:349 (-),score=46.65 TRINITY_DN1348_c0_g1_i3:278-1324(-)
MSTQQFDRVVKRCHCVRSKCLRLYCDCFAANIMCDGCKCTDCHNTASHSYARRQAMEYKLARKKTAFEPKFQATADSEASDFLHVRGCNCKKSGCSKKYCECFQAGVACSNACKCKKCVNDGSLMLPRRDMPEVSDWIMVLAKTQQKFDEMSERTGLLEGDQLVEIADWVFDTLVSGEVEVDEREDRCEALLTKLSPAGTMAFSPLSEWLRTTVTDLSKRFPPQPLAGRRVPKPIPADLERLTGETPPMPYVFSQLRPKRLQDCRLMPPPMPQEPCAPSVPSQLWVRQQPTPCQTQQMNQPLDVATAKRKRVSRPSILKKPISPLAKSARLALLQLGVPGNPSVLNLD